MNQKKILLIDDELDILEILSYNLEKEGYAQIDYQYTDDCIISDFENNEIEFTKDGKIFNS